VTVSRIKQVMASVLEVPEESINEASSNDNIGSWDSIQHMNLVLALEEEFDVAILDEDAANITSFPLIRIVVNELLES